MGALEIDPEDEHLLRGCKVHDSAGYKVVNFDGTSHFVHRLVMRQGKGDGKLDNMEIDHIDGNPSNCKKSNLQLVSRATNCQKRNHKTSKTGYIGVKKCAKANRYQAAATVRGKFRHLGNFGTAQEAGRAYDEFVLAHHGPHARTNMKCKPTH